MNKKTIFKNLLKVAVISLLTMQSACVIATNCYKVGYSQEVNGSFFDENASKGYFIYSYLDKKDSKAYFLYKIDLNGKAEKIADLGSRLYDARKQNENYLKYEFNILPNDKMLLQETESSYNNNKMISSSSSFYYYVDLKDKNLIYKKDALSSSYFDTEKKNIINNSNKGIDVFNIEKGTYYNNTIINNEKDTYLQPKWMNNNTIVVLKSNKVKENSIFIYELKDNNINKLFEYKINPNEENTKDMSYINPQNYSNNVLEFEADFHKENKVNVLESTKRINTVSEPMYYIGTNLYQLDFSSNKLSLIKSDVPRKSILPVYTPKVFLEASKQMYLEYSGSNPMGNSKKPLFDYLNELPKGFYSDEFICGDYKTMDKLNP